MKNKTLTLEMCQRQAKAWRNIRLLISAVAVMMSLFISAVFLMLMAGGNNEFSQVVIGAYILHILVHDNAKREIQENIINIAQNAVILAEREIESHDGENPQ